MKKITNFGSRGSRKLVKKRNNKKLARLAVIIAVIGALTVGIREIAVDYLKNLRDSIHSAESQFEDHIDQATLQVQLFILRQQADNATAKAAAKDPDSEKQFLEMIPSAISEVNERKTDLNADYESVSTLLNKLPPGFKPLRDQLPTAKSTIDRTDRAAQELLGKATSTNAEHYANTRLALALYAAADLPLIILGGVTVAEAKKIEGDCDIVIKFCNDLVYLLVAIGALLGVYAAWLRLRTVEA